MTVRKRLFDMEIDEISLVDRGANQHAAIVISKADGFEEDQMPQEIDVLYDSDGDLVDYDLEHGDVVYDEMGNEYVFLEEDDEEYDEYGKSQSFSKAKAAANGKKKKPMPVEEETSKSLGDVVLEELSKAASEDERSYIISKAMEEVEIAKEAANEAWDRVAAQEDAMLEDAFISKASEYNLPVDPVDFGQILKAASTVLDYDQLDMLDQLFSSVGEALYEEIGYVGDTDNASVLDVVDSYVGEVIGKADATPEMIQTAVFDANPDAYDAYLAENRW